MGMGWSNWLYVARTNPCFIAKRGYLFCVGVTLKTYIKCLLDLIFLIDRKFPFINVVKKEKLFHLNRKPHKKTHSNKKTSHFSEYKIQK